MATKGEMFAGADGGARHAVQGRARSITTACGKLVDWHVEQGTDCLAPCGTTGESPTLDHEEHERVIAAVVEQARGRIKVMPGTGSNSTREAIRLTKSAKQGRRRRRADGRAVLQQADAGRLLPPLRRRRRGGRPADRALQHPGPHRLEHRCPRRSPGWRSCRSIVAVKEATGSLDQASQIAALCDLTILTGDDSLTLPLMSIGGRGVISVVGNIVPRDMKALLDGLRGRASIAEALKWHRKLFPLCRDMLGVATNPIPIKTAMKLLGRDTGELRLPMCAMDAASEAKLARRCRRMGCCNSHVQRRATNNINYGDVG